jgi:tRNA(Ile)-lysidine synthase
LIKSEDDARKFRYEFLRKIAEKENCDFIATAHHKNDQVETLFLQLLR